jgi:hypothetical protein
MPPTRTWTRRDVLTATLTLTLTLPIPARADDPDDGASEDFEVELELELGEPIALDGVSELPEGDADVSTTIRLGSATFASVGAIDLGSLRLLSVDVDKAPSRLGDAVSAASRRFFELQVKAKAPALSKQLVDKVTARPSVDATKACIVTGATIALAAIAGAAAGGSAPGAVLSVSAATVAVGLQAYAQAR